MLEYSKPVMRFGEFVKMGVPKETINQAIAEKNICKKNKPCKGEQCFYCSYCKH